MGSAREYTPDALRRCLNKHLKIMENTELHSEKWLKAEEAFHTKYHVAQYRLPNDESKQFEDRYNSIGVES